MSSPSARECYLNEQVSKYRKLCTLYAGMRIISWIAHLFLFISFIIHWFQNDGFSFIQNLKWSFNSYSLLWLFIIFWNIFYTFKVTKDVSLYKSFQAQLVRERKLREMDTSSK